MIKTSSHVLVRWTFRSSEIETWYQTFQVADLGPLAPPGTAHKCEGTTHNKPSLKGMSTCRLWVLMSTSLTKWRTRLWIGWMQTLALVTVSRLPLPLTLQLLLVPHQHRAWMGQAFWHFLHLFLGRQGPEENPLWWIGPHYLLKRYKRSGRRWRSQRNKRKMTTSPQHLIKLKSLALVG
jgi:hypothetical protein